MISVKAENRYFDVFPKVVRADEETGITIRPLFAHGRFDDQTNYQVTYFPVEEFAEKSGWPEKSHPSLHLKNGNLCFSQYFEDEQEHVLLLESVAGEKRILIGDFRVYSLKSDLFTRRPYKGDFHLHSYRSDGRESPGYVAGACRRIGLDFMAVTDHEQYAPSIEAQEAFQGVDLDLRIYPGEEVHPPDNPVHIINFGGRFSLNERFKNDEATYRAEVKTIEDSLPTLPPGVNRHQYASCVWCFEKIREASGLGIFCHPYWFDEHRYANPGALTSVLLEHQPYDALELISGYSLNEANSNTLQVARYHQERVQGRQIPIVGVSDAHGCERNHVFGWYYTIVFSPSPELSDIVASVKGLYSVAVEALPNETVRAYGPFRLVKYALFLLREVLPQHDELCVEEGRLMLAHLAGDRTAAEQLKKLKGRTAALLHHYWGGSRRL